MDIFQTRLYRINVNLLRSIGQWPYQEKRLTQWIHQILFQITIFTVILTQSIKLHEIWGDLDIMIECLTPMGVQLIACVKSINCMINREKMTKLSEMVRRDWSVTRDNDEIEILTRFAEQGRILTLLYAGFLSSTTVLYLAIPLMPRILDVIMPLNASRERTYLYHTEYYVDPEEYFYPILFHTYTTSVITIAIVTAVDAMYACYVHHVCGILAITGHRLKNLRKVSATKTHSSEDDDKCYREFVRCINRHFEATEFASLIETAHSTAYLVTIGISVVLLSISAVQLVIKLGQYDEMIRLLQFNFAQFTHLLFNSWPGQKLLDQSVCFRDSVYFAEWYSWSIRTKKLVRIVMLRALKPQKITAGKLYDMSMENFGAVVQTSLSYFTVFASLR